MTPRGDLRLVTPPRAFITRAPSPADAMADATMPRRRATDPGAPDPHDADDLSMARALLVWASLGLGFWIGVIYAIRLILR